MNILLSKVESMKLLLCYVVTVITVSYSKGWFSLAHKNNASEDSSNISINISMSIRRTNPLVFLMLFSLGITTT